MRGFHNSTKVKKSTPKKKTKNKSVAGLIQGSKTKNGNQSISFESCNLHQIPDCSTFMNCTRLSLSHNPIRTFDHFPTFPLLKSLRLEDTKIDSFKGALMQPSLTHINLALSPISANKFLIEMCLIVFGNQLISINGFKISNSQINYANAAREYLLPELKMGWVLTSKNPIRLMNPFNRQRKSLQFNLFKHQSPLKNTISEENLDDSMMGDFSANVIQHLNKEEHLDNILLKLISISKEFNKVPKQLPTIQDTKMDHLFQTAEILVTAPRGILMNSRLWSEPKSIAKRIIEMPNINRDSKPFIQQRLEDIVDFEYSRSSSQDIHMTKTLSIDENNNFIQKSFSQNDKVPQNDLPKSEFSESRINGVSQISLPMPILKEKNISISNGNEPVENYTNNDSKKNKVVFGGENNIMNLEEEEERDDKYTLRRRRSLKRFSLSPVISDISKTNKKAFDSEIRRVIEDVNKRRNDDKYRESSGFLVRHSSNQHFFKSKFTNPSILISRNDLSKSDNKFEIEDYTSNRDEDENTP